MRFRDHKDWRVTVFPPYALVVFILMSPPAAVILGLVAVAQCRLAVRVRDHRHVSDLRVHALRCHVDENSFCAALPVRQHAAPASHGAPQWAG